ncbi:MAG: putative sugar nucleotidyl transferase, partial [Spirochaetota bacterium]
SFSGLPKKELSPDAFFPEFIWNMILSNGDMIRRDYPLIDTEKNRRENYQVTFQGDASQIYIGDNVSIDPFVVIDARKGPVIIQDGCEINPFTRREGPCSIGRDCVLLGAKVREGCSFGPACRIGGEVEDSIFQSFSNKYHDGFIGHAYIGQWVNLGALTTNSDLKNDYSAVKVYLPGGLRDTGSAKAGCIIGDFVKTGIGTLLNTGSVLGTGSMAVMSGRMTPPHLPAFCRFIKNEIRPAGSTASVVETARTVSARRKQKFPAAMETLLESLYRAQAQERDRTADEWNSALK